jgi:hypothetical protein
VLVCSGGNVHTQVTKIVCAKCSMSPCVVLLLSGIAVVLRVRICSQVRSRRKLRKCSDVMCCSMHDGIASDAYCGLL